TDSYRDVSRWNRAFGTTPWPRQREHQPWGELNENNRGSSSSKERWQPGQLASEDSRTKRLSGVNNFSTPFPISSARGISVARFALAALEFFPVEPFGPPGSSATTTSMSCSLKRSSRVKPSAFT